MLKKVLLSAVLAFYPYYCYSESIVPYFGVTPNAALGGHSWNMDNVFPEPPGLEVNGVFYSYTPDKLAEDEFHVTVGNKGVWSDTEDWTGAPGGIEVRKVIGLPNVPREAWGDGYITTEGNGVINDPTVIYSYKVDPCFDPQFDPNCPGYVVPQPVIVEIDLDSIYDATEDEFVDLDDENKLPSDEEIEESNQEEIDDTEEADRRKYREQRAEELIGIVAVATENQRILAMNNIAQQAVNVQYVSATIPGGSYSDNVILIDKKIDDNKQGLRNGLAQQLLHEQMVGMQYQQ